MSTALDIDLEELLQLDEPGDGLLHGVHTDCQLDQEEATATCGEKVPWYTLTERTDLPHCKGCWHEDAQCPVCGCWLVPSVL